MTDIRKPKAELRAYIYWGKVWRHVYIISGYDQQSLLGDPVKMLEFKLSLRTKITYSAEKSLFHRTPPAKSKPIRRNLA